MLIRWKNKDKDKEKCEKGSSQKQNSTMGTSKKKRKFGRDGGKWPENNVPPVYQRGTNCFPMQMCGDRLA
ncbi:unnamed protein product [Acanthoscelides obtectus]|uniref:Uncharacterized protein n=1 Tax=Acanthoscelides obtectus TaxID=200917 RepID=A0A9P0JZD0_ACAOB|nr:unnamed protein product [Acanthoscelides obtectus]CAK1621902.1 hypothetical protein AOBTE_LOCUS1207 [Acanthoscelides obtectus]